jgi:hypothetical protein
VARLSRLIAISQHREIAEKLAKSFDRCSFGNFVDPLDVQNMMEHLCWRNQDVEINIVLDGNGTSFMEHKGSTFQLEPKLEVPTI